MGRKGREIVGLDTKKLVEELNRCIADEWLAAFQYWVFAQIAEGLNAPPLIESFKKGVTDELEHASKLAQRVVQLQGKPISEPTQLLRFAHVKYPPPPKNPANLKQMIKSALEIEAAAIEAYNSLAKKTSEKDPVTYDLAVELLEDEVREEEDLENLLATL